MARKLEWYDFGPYDELLVRMEDEESFVKMRGMDLSLLVAQGKQYIEIRRCTEDCTDMYWV